MKKGQASFIWKKISLSMQVDCCFKACCNYNWLLLSQPFCDRHGWELFYRIHRLMDDDSSFIQLKPSNQREVEVWSWNVPLPHALAISKLEAAKRSKQAKPVRTGQDVKGPSCFKTLGESCDQNNVRMFRWKSAQIFLLHSLRMASLFLVQIGYS